MVDVIGIGENSVDLVYRLPALPAAGASKVPITGQAVRCGGQVATTLATCAALGLKTRYVGAFGNDGHAALIRAALRRGRVDLRDAVARRAPNRYAVILVDESSGDRLVLFHRDPRLALRPRDLARLTWRARWVHVDTTDEEAALSAADHAASARIHVSCDVDRATPATRALVRHIDVPIFAEQVPHELTGERDPAKALRRLCRPHHLALCVTLGSRGALMLHGGRVYRAPAFRVRAVDTTGAGDVFRGAFIYAMLRGQPPREVLRFANAAAAISCTRHGALDSVPTRAQVAALLRRA